MEYVPFKDYFSLSNVIWNADLLSELNSIMGPPQCNSGLLNNESGLILNDRPASDPLDDIRFNAHDDFRRNGVECDLDEIDMYQHQIREVRAQADAENPAMTYFLKRNHKRKTKKVCVFCKNNGEIADLYTSHVLKDAEGRVTCPVLRKYTCPLCGTNGDGAHTIRYCPKNSSGASPGLLLFLKSTRDCAGRPKAVHGVKH